jgi:hypothetical protein
MQQFLKLTIMTLRGVLGRQWRATSSEEIISNSGLQRLSAILNVFSELQKTQLHGVFIYSVLFSKVYRYKTVAKVIN